jgi:hypothetical protein
VALGRSAGLAEVSQPIGFIRGLEHLGVMRKAVQGRRRYNACFHW